MKFVQEKDLGFRKEHVVTIRLNEAMKKKRELFKDNLLEYPLIEKVAFSYTVPGSGGNYEGFSLDGENFNMQVYQIDPDYVGLMGIKIKEGRDFSWNLESDKSGCCLINEALAFELGKDSLVGKHFDHQDWYVTAIPEEEIEIIGIVKDFHYQSLHVGIRPLMMVWGESWINFINIRIQSENIDKSLELIEREWNAICPEYPFDYSFMDENFERMYRSEQRLEKIFGYFAALAVLIAIMGLFGLAAYIAEQRTREIGIRKAMGATMVEISVLMVKEFTWLILIASVIAWTVAWYWAKNWLQEFVYRMDLGIWIFILATLMALVIAWITVLFHTLKAANANPADSLRYE